MKPGEAIGGATPYRKLVVRIERLRRLLGLPSKHGGSLTTPAPAAVLEEEVRLIEQARDEWEQQTQAHAAKVGEHLAGSLEGWMDWNERQDVEHGVSGSVYASRERALRNSPEGAGPVCRVVILPLEKEGRPS